MRSRRRLLFSSAVIVINRGTHAIFYGALLNRIALSKIDPSPLAAIGSLMHSDGFIGSLYLESWSRFHAPIFAAVSGEVGLREKSRRTTWPFHIQSPETSNTGRKT